MRPASKIVAVEIPKLWCLVLYNSGEIGGRVLAKLSAGAELVFCLVEDHVMFSSASDCNCGTQIWIPAELAKKLTGFRHDQDIPGMTHKLYQRLEPAGINGGKTNLLTRLASRFKRKSSVE